MPTPTRSPIDADLEVRIAGLEAKLTAVIEAVEALPGRLVRPAPEGMLTAKDLARLLGVSRRTIDALDALDEGRDLPRSIRVGRQRRWAWKNIEGWLANRADR